MAPHQKKRYTYVYTNIVVVGFTTNYDNYEISAYHH
jgi:hypothetical protein